MQCCNAVDMVVHGRSGGIHLGVVVNIVSVIVVALRDQKSWEFAEAPATTELSLSSEAKTWLWDMLGLAIALSS